MLRAATSSISPTLPQWCPSHRAGLPRRRPTGPLAPERGRDTSLCTRRTTSCTSWVAVTSTARSWRGFTTRLAEENSTTTRHWRGSRRTGWKYSADRGHSCREVDSLSLKRRVRECYFQRADIDVRPLL